MFFVALFRVIQQLFGGGGRNWVCLALFLALGGGCVSNKLFDFGSAEGFLFL